MKEHQPMPNLAAERMRLHRERRRLGLRCLMIQLRETEIDALIRIGLLKPDMRVTIRGPSMRPPLKVVRSYACWGGSRPVVDFRAA